MNFYLSFVQGSTILIIYYYICIKLIPKNRIDFLSFNLLFFYHLSFAILYVAYSIYNVSDAKTIWYVSQFNEFNHYSERILSLDIWEIGRGSSIILATFLYKVFKFDYVAMTIFYSLISFTGILLLYSLVSKYKNNNNFNYLSLFLFFPSMHFWNCSISKDAITFFAISLFIFCFLTFRKYSIWMIISLSIMFLFRPYIGVVFVFFLFFDFIFNYKIKLVNKIYLITLLSFIFFYLLQFSLSYIGIYINNLFNIPELYASISKILSEANKVAQTQSAYIDKGSTYNILYYYFVYLFFPLNFFSENKLYIISSFENLTLIIFLTLLLFYKNFKKIDFNDVILIFIFIVILTLLSVRTMNYGISIRQKWMILPLLYFFLINKNQLNKNDNN